MILVNRTLLRSLAVIILFSLSAELYSQTNSFYVYFIQNNKRFNITEDKIELKKEPFQIYVEYTEPVDIIVHASVKEGNFRKASRGKLLYELPGMQYGKNVKSFFQNKHAITLDEDHPTIWYKNETDGEKSAKNEDGRYVCLKEVERMLDTKKGMMLANENMQYFVQMIFIYAEKDESGQQIEIERELVKIKWVEFYDEETKLYERQKEKTGKERIRIAEQNLRQKQRMEKKEKKALDKLEMKKKKALEKKEKKKKKREEKERQKLEEDKEESNIN